MLVNKSSLGKQSKRRSKKDFKRKKKSRKLKKEFKQQFNKKRKQKLRSNKIRSRKLNLISWRNQLKTQQSQRRLHLESLLDRVLHVDFCGLTLWKHFIITLELLNKKLWDSKFQDQNFNFWFQCQDGSMII